MKPSLLGALCLALASLCAAQAPPSFGYAVARDPLLRRDGLLLVDLAGGNTLELGPLARGGLAGLEFAPNGALLAFDPATAELVELAPLDGRERTRTALPIPPPGAGAPCGLALDSSGRLLVACGTPASLYEIDLCKPSKAKLRGELPARAIGLATLGDGLLALLAREERAVLALRPDQGSPVPLRGPALPDFENGDLAYDARGILHALDEEGALLVVDPVDGRFTRTPFLVVEEAHGLALPIAPLCAYAFEDDGRGALLRLDLATGRIERLPPSAPRRAIALAAARDGRLLALDDEADRLLAVDPLSGATTPLDLPLGADIDGGGIAFDAAQNLWLADASGALYLVDDVRGDAEFRGNLGRAVQALSFDGARLLALEGDQLLVLDAANVAATPLPAPLGGLGSSGASISAGPTTGLFGLTRGGVLFGASGSSGAGLSLARLGVFAPRGLSFTACPAGLATLVVDRAQLALDRAQAANDAWSMRGTTPSAGLSADLTGATIEVLLNGRALTPPTALDERGRFRSPRGASPALDLRLDGDGSFDLDFRGLDLAALVPFADGDARLPLLLEIELRIVGAGLAEPRTRARVVLDARVRAGRDLRASLARNGDRADAGLALETATAREIVDFSHRLRVKGRLLPAQSEGVAVIDDPRTERDVRITFGPTAIEISYDEFRRSGSKLRYKDRRRGVIGGLRELVLDTRTGSFQVLTYPLADTGLPLAETGAATAYALPFSIRVPTPSGPLFFATRIDLRRAQATAKDWSRRRR